MGDWPVEENFDRAVKELERAEGKAEYWFWPPSMDTVPDGAGAFAVNKPVTDSDIQEMIEEGIFCQGVINYIRRFNGKVVPYDPWWAGPPEQRRLYDGGTWANQRFFSEFLREYTPWQRIPRGAMILRPFRWAGAPGFSAVIDQGHVGVLLEEQHLATQKPGLLLHSHPAVGGLARTNLQASHDGGYYRWWVHPEDWIAHNLGKFE
jgi:hypothetical protein